MLTAITALLLTRARRGRSVIQQERGGRGEHGQGLILSFRKSVQHEKYHIFYAD